MAIRDATPPTATHSELLAVIADNVRLVRLPEALARAGLVGRHDPDRGVLVIEPAQGLANPQTAIPPDAELGIRRYNGLTKPERVNWHTVAGCAVPADAWRAFQSGATLPD